MLPMRVWVSANTEIEYLRSFLEHVGVRAEVELDENNERVIIISTASYRQRSASIEAWFTLISQNEQFSYFRERLRGVDQTE
ncbi:MAG TPA: hypothetical protein VHD90_15975 [Phototrophicaceae bacterium]|nr:hypothetical protein [Phototrophicaceae bacterium]